MAAQNQAVTAENAELKILRRKQVETRTGLSRSSIYAGVSAGTFPKPIQLGVQSVGWLESEISSWLRERIAASRPTESTGGTKQQHGQPVQTHAQGARHG